MSISTLNHHLERLVHWMSGVGTVPEFEGILLIEADKLFAAFEHASVLGGLFTRRPTVMRSWLQSPEEFEQRFSELLNSGYEWIHLKARGLLESHLVVSVDHPLERSGISSDHVTVNIAGPPASWKLDWRLTD